MKITSTNWYDFVIGGLLIVSMLLYWTCRSSHQESLEASQKIHDLEKEVSNLQSKITNINHTVTTITKTPDGTVVEKTEKTENSTQVLSQNTVKNIEFTSDTQVKETKNDLTRYSISVYRSLNDSKYAADVGARLGNTPFEAVGLTTDSGHDIYLGVRFSW